MEKIFTRRKTHVQMGLIESLMKYLTQESIKRVTLENTFFKRDKNRLKSYVIAEQKVSHNIDDKYICHRQDAEYDCTIFY